MDLLRKMGQGNRQNPMFTKLCHTLLKFQLYLDSLEFENIMVVKKNMALS